MSRKWGFGRVYPGLLAGTSLLTVVLAACGGSSGDVRVVVTAQSTTSGATAVSMWSVDTPISFASPTAVAVDRDEVWIGSAAGDVTLFDASGGEVASFPIVCGVDQIGARNSVDDLALTGSKVWVACSEGILVIDRFKLEVVTSIDFDYGFTSMAETPGAIWGAVRPVPAARAVDTGDVSAMNRIDLPNACDLPQQIVASGTVLWMVSHTTDSCSAVLAAYSNSRIHKIDSLQGRITWESDAIPDLSVRIAVLGGELWVSGGESGSLTVLDSATGETLAEVEGSWVDPRVLGADGAFVWVANHWGDAEQSSVVVVDAQSRAVLDRIELAGPTDVAIDDSVTWIAYNQGAARIVRQQ